VRNCRKGPALFALVHVIVGCGVLGGCQTPRVLENGPPVAASAHPPVIVAAGEERASAPEPPIAPDAIAPPLATTPLDSPTATVLSGHWFTETGQQEAAARPAQVSFTPPPVPNEATPPGSAGKKAARPLALALEAFLANRPEEAIRHLEIYAPRDQELVMRLMPVLSTVDQVGLLTAQPKPELVQRALDAVRQIEADLRPLAPLRLERLTFCREVRLYGRFSPILAARFQPGDACFLYAELYNLVDRRMPDGKAVGPIEPLQPAADYSASPRHDNFVRITFRVPAHLPPGPYTLRVRIDDLDTGRVAEAALPFQVVSRR
jgi:hypothetical protein